MASREHDLESGHNPRTSTATTSTTPLPDDYAIMASTASNPHLVPQNAVASSSTNVGVESVQQHARAPVSTDHADSSRPMSMPARVPSPSVQPRITLSTDAHPDLEAGRGTLNFGVDIPLPQPSHVASQLAQRFVPPAAMSEFNHLRSSLANYVHTQHQPPFQPDPQFSAQHQANPSPPQSSLQQSNNMTRRYTDTGAYAAAHRQRSTRATSAGSFEKASYPGNDGLGRYPAISPPSRHFDLGSLDEKQAESSGGGGGEPPSQGDGGSGQRLLRQRSSDMRMPHIEPSVEERLRKTLEDATIERDKYERKAKLYGQAHSIAIGIQVVLSALITALSAVTTGRSTSITTSVLGGMGTIVATLTAKLQGTNEPELSVQRIKDLDSFKRRLQAFIKDKGHHSGREFDKEIMRLRSEFEYLLGNGDGERRMTTPSMRIG